MDLRMLRAGSNKRAWLLYGAIALVVVGAVCGFLLVRTLGNRGDDPKLTASTASAIRAVGDLYILPKDEQPTVAKITDRSQLDGQEFFDAAQNGDILLVYKRAKLALVYRPSAGKLVNVGPVTFPNDDGKTAGTR